MAFAHSISGQRRRRGHNPLAAPLFLFAAVLAAASAYVGYVLWPRWPDAPVAGGAPALPIVIAGEHFVVEPAAIRMSLQRRAGTQDRVDLAYAWPGLAPAAHTPAPAPGSQAPTAERLFVTIQTANAALSPIERVEMIYPRYLVAEPVPGPAGLTLRGFRDDSPYKGEELAFDAKAPKRFLARCARQGVVGPGHCLLERRIGNADLTFRFPRDWLGEWRTLADGIDTLISRLQPQS
jgi:hypothetical protein